MDKIFIKGLKIEAMIGIYAHERAAKQPLSVDVDLYTPISLAAKSMSILDTIDYDLVARRIKDIAGERHYDLVETLASYVAEILLKEFNAAEVHCTIYKPNAINDATAAGVTVIRKYDDW